MLKATHLLHVEFYRWWTRYLFIDQQADAAAVLRHGSPQPLLLLERDVLQIQEHRAVLKHVHGRQGPGQDGRWFGEVASEARTHLVPGNTRKCVAHIHQLEDRLQVRF